MGTEVASYDLKDPAGGEPSQWSSDALIHFEAFRAAFCAWHDATAALDWIQHNDYAVVLLSTSNLLPSHFTFEESSSASSPVFSSSSSEPTVGLVLHAPCCGVSVTLSVEEQLTLVQLPRVLPFHAMPIAERDSSGAAKLAAQLTLSERRQRIVEALLARAHKDDCAWRDPVLSDCLSGEQLHEASCSLRQLLLGGPSLALTDSTLVHSFCAAVNVRAGAGPSASGSGSKGAPSRGRCLLPRGTPPSVLRRLVDDSVGVLEASQVWDEGAGGHDDGDARRARLAPLRYTGSSVNDRILHLFFTPKKRERQDTTSRDDTARAATGVTEEVVMEYMGLLMGLYGYSVTAEFAQSPTDERVIEEEESDEACRAGIEARDSGTDSTTGPSASPATTWDGPPTLVNSQESQQGNQKTRVETVRQCRTLPAADTVGLLGRRIACRYCAHAPWISVQQEDLTTITTTTTTTTTVVITKAAPLLSQRTDGVAGGTSGMRGGVSTAHSTIAEKAECEVTVESAGTAGELANRGAKRECVPGISHPECGQAPSLSHSAVASSEDRERNEEAVEELRSSETASSTAEQRDEADHAGPSRHEHDGPIRESHAASALAAEPLDDDDSDGDVGTPASFPKEPVHLSDTSANQAGPAAITTVTKAVTTTSTRKVKQSTTTITATFSCRNSDPYKPGHRACCPWHKLFLTEAIDATALATAERCMDFTWVVDSAEDKLTPEEDGCENEDATEAADDCEEETHPAVDSVANDEPNAKEDSPSIRLEVTGTAVTLACDERKAEEREEAVAGDAEVGSGEDGVVEVSHRTVLVLRFFLSEVERLITTWRLSEEWEHTRPSQYLQHPLWRTWSTSNVLHPIHTEAADGAMEQYLRTLERRLLPTVTVEGDEGQADGASCTLTASSLVEAPGSREALLTTIGAPLYQPSTFTTKKTAEAALHLAEASLKKCFGANNKATAAARRDTTSARSLLKVGLQSLLATSELSASQVVGSVGAHEHAAEEGGLRPSTVTAAVVESGGGACCSEASAADAFLSGVQQRYNNDLAALKNSPLHRFCAVLHRDALPQVLYPFLAPHYCTLHTAIADAMSSSSTRPSDEALHTTKPHPTGSVAGKEADTPFPSSVYHAMSSTDRATVAQFLQSMRQTSQEEQLELQRGKELEAQRAAAAAAAAAKAPAASPPAAASKASASVTQASPRTATPSSAAQQRQQKQHASAHVNQRSTTSAPAGGGVGSAKPPSQHQGGHPQASLPSGPLQHPRGPGQERWSNYHPPQQPLANAVLPPQLPPGSWNGGADFSASPPPVFFGFEGNVHPTAADVFNPSQPVLLQGDCGRGETVAEESSGAGGVLSGGFPFGWSPLASGSEGLGGSHNSSGRPGGGGILSFSGPGPMPLSSSPLPPPPVLFGGYNDNENVGVAQSLGYGGGRASDGRNPRSTFAVGSANMNNLSVLSSDGSSADEVRLSNWSAHSNPKHSAGGGSGGGVLPLSGAGVLVKNVGGGAYGSENKNTGNSGTNEAARPAVPPSSAPSLFQGRGGASGAVAPRRGDGDAGGRPQAQNSSSNQNLSSSSGKSASGAVLGGGAGGGGSGRSGRGRSRGGSSRRGGGGGGGGRGNYRRGGA
ncbi:hypothetical protein ABL78_1012 [Leptomonas seymouri]|uniref:Uncharacterized protein n=1 Tax=Leptomonas seymouri TaxID=5684 RepID=A0A0N1IB65_LEPSE|nr:hypothetical protein ABL78_1012 [Leptomonas seymouri]|eukprot:KPI89843.1 hypothetical protein ABL78_1012 [Leptomonas seymouri]